MTDTYAIDLAAFRALGEALAIGLLVGIERYRDRQDTERRSAGVRTFTIMALTGAVCGLVDQVVLTSVTFAALAAFLWLGYYRSSRQRLGLTTEFAAVLVFWLGYLARHYELPALAAGIILTIVLAMKRELHDFVRESLTEREFYDTLKFLAVALVVYPLLPDRTVGPWGFFNPSEAWLLVVVVSAISYFGYLAMRLLGATQGMEVSGLIGGIVSTTAVTMSLAERAKVSPAHSRICGVTAVMANAVQFPRLLALAWIVDATLALHLAAPLLAMGAVGLGGSLLLARRLDQPPELDLGLVNPFSLRVALKFGLFFVFIFFLVRAGEALFGTQGIYAASLLAGTGDASAITLSAAGLVRDGALSAPAAGIAVFLAVTTNAVVKWVLALVTGTRQVAFWLGGGLLTMLAVGAGVLVLVRG